MSRLNRDWGELIREQLSSGKSQAEFCRERGLSIPSFQYHKSKGAHHLKEQSGFVPIVGESGESRIEIRYGEEVKLLFPETVSAERVSEVVKCLSSR